MTDTAPPPAARFVWADPHGAGRNRYALFRRSFHLSAPPAPDSVLHLFADCRYRLLVNGITVCHGPARFFVTQPEYDTIDLTPHLRPGANTLALIVNSYNAVSFQTDVSTAGLIAWGEARDAGGQVVDLATQPGGAWKAIDSPGHEPATHYLSFALGPAELLDARQMPAGWDAPGFDDAAWPAVVERVGGRWGPLRPRSIPLLDESLVTPERRLGAWAACPQPGERVDSLFVVAPGGQSLHTRGRVAVLTYLHSPRAQDVTLGAWWGRHFLNGVELKGQPRPDLGMRQDYAGHLQAGWNALLVYERLGYDYWDFSLALPAAAAIEVSAERVIGSPHTFLIGGPWVGALAERADSVAWPLSAPEALPAELGPWRPWPRNGQSNFPMKQRGWRTFQRLEGTADAAASVAPLARQVGPDGVLSLLYEFPGEMLARPLVDFTAAAGTVLDLTYSERLAPDGTSAVHLHPWGIHMAERFIARAGRQTLHTFHPRGFHYLEVLGRGDLSAFELHRVAATRAQYPVQPIGQFECSDPLLNRIWALGPATQHACMEDAYLDCPGRERGVYAGDMLVQFAVNLACFGDTALMRRCLELFLLSQDGADNGLIAGGAFGLPAGRHPDYSAIIVLALHAYWARTGDVAALRALLPRFRRLVEGLANLRSRDPVLLDGSDLGPYIDNSHVDKTGVSCALNCFYQRAFHDAAELFALLGEAGLATAYREKAARLAAAIAARFWDDARGVFTDRLPGDVPSPEPSVPANVLPLLWNIASPAQAERVWPWLLEALAHNFRVPEPKRYEDLNVNAYFSFYALGVLYQHGHAEAAEQFMRTYWGQMVEAGAWTCWEFLFDHASRCHAWSAAPTHYLSTAVLGVHFPVAGDVNQVEIRPQPGTLAWARGVYPHPAGPIRVSWRREGAKVAVECAAPPGVQVRVAT